MRIGKNISYSQNFLHSKILVNRLINKSNITSQDTVIDIGTGKGIITSVLQSHVRLLHSIEADRNYYCHALKSSSNSNTKFYNIDFLEFDLPSYGYKVFVNIPFNYTSRIIKKLYFGTERVPEDSYITIQKEAYFKYSGKTRESQISLLLRPFYTIEVIHKFKRSDFSPTPKVEVYFIHISKKSSFDIELCEKAEYFDFVSFLSNIWVKVIKHALLKVFTYNQVKKISNNLNIDMARPLTNLTYRNYIELFYLFRSYGTVKNRKKIMGSYKKQRSLEKKLKKVYRTN